MKNTLFLAVAFMGLLSSCSPRLTPFTSDLQSSLDWSDNDLKKVQFYLSNDIVLYKEASLEKSVVEEGKIKIKETSSREKIVFRKGTAGVLLFTPKSDRFAVSFEEDGGQNKFLMFGPSDKSDGRYVLLAKKWNQNRGKVTYDNTVYSTPSASAYTSLMVDVKSAKRTNYKSSIAKGRKVINTN